MKHNVIVHYLSDRECAPAAVIHVVRLVPVPTLCNIARGVGPHGTLAVDAKEHHVQVIVSDCHAEVSNG